MSQGHPQYPMVNHMGQILMAGFAFLFVGGTSDDFCAMGLQPVHSQDPASRVHRKTEIPRPGLIVLPFLGTSFLFRHHRGD